MVAESLGERGITCLAGRPSTVASGSCRLFREALRARRSRLGEARWQILRRTIIAISVSAEAVGTVEVPTTVRTQAAGAYRCSTVRVDGSEVCIGREVITGVGRRTQPWCHFEVAHFYAAGLCCTRGPLISLICDGVPMGDG